MLIGHLLDNTAYFMNSIAINAEGNFFSFVKTDPALFHSILYLVALHYNLKRGLLDSPECLYHGSEAFKLINRRLDGPHATFSDMTLAAVAMLANKEVSLISDISKNVTNILTELGWQIRTFQDAHARIGVHDPLTGWCSQLQWCIPKNHNLV